MEGELRKHFKDVLSQKGISAVECFDSEGLPILSEGNSDKNASYLLSTIYKHARLIAEEEDAPIVIIERENSSIVLSQSGDYLTAVHQKNGP